MTFVARDLTRNQTESFSSSSAITCCTYRSTPGRVYFSLSDVFQYSAAVLRALYGCSSLLFRLPAKAIWLSKLAWCQARRTAMQGTLKELLSTVCDDDVWGSMRYNTVF